MKASPNKILIITYYWPPAGGPGVQRWLKFVKYLPEFGWKPTVFIPENPSYPLIDDSLREEVPKEINIIRTKIWEPYRFAEKINKNNKKFKAGQFDVGKNQGWRSKISIWVRGNFFIPDARIFWVTPSVQYLKKYLSENHIDTLVTTGPPHSMHLIGLRLKKEFPHLKWVADFRDPWTEISYYQHLKLTKIADQKHRLLEKQVFENADITLATSYTDADQFRKKGAKAFCITNGFDNEMGINCSSSKQFVLSYIGVLEQLRNPEILWTVLKELIDENIDFQKDFQIKMVGKVDDKIMENLQKSSLQPYIVNLGYLSHHKAIEEMLSSSLLLLTNFPNNRSAGIIPGKIFEYLATGRQILSFGPENADVATILQKTQAGQHFTYVQKEEVKNYIWQQYLSWKSGKNIPISSHIKEFSRKNLTKKLVEILQYPHEDL